MKKIYKIRDIHSKKYINYIHPWCISEKDRVSYSTASSGGRVWVTLVGAQRFVLNLHYNYPPPTGWTLPRVVEMYNSPEWMFWHRTVCSSLEIVECLLEEIKTFSFENIVQSKISEKYKNKNSYDKRR